MAIQNPAGPRPGGTATALALNGPTVIKSSSGTLWSANVSTFGGIGAGLYDSATIAGAGPANLIWSLTGVGPYPGEPIAFANGLVYIADAGTTSSVGFA